MSSQPETLSEAEISTQAEQHGVSLSYIDAFGQPKAVSLRTCEKVLDILRPSVSTEDPVLPACWVTPEHTGDEPYWLHLALPLEACQQALPWEIITEAGDLLSGTFQTPHHSVEPRPNSQLTNIYLSADVYLPLHQHPTTGYHQFRLQTPDGQWHTTRWIITPTACYVPEIFDRQSLWGLALQLYSVRSKRNWGCGDFKDLLNTVDWLAENGGSLIGLNPLHELFPNNPEHASPYSPSSRSFFNTFYIALDWVEEYQNTPGIQAKVQTPEFQEKLTSLRAQPYVAYGEIAALKKPILELLFQRFQEEELQRNTHRAQAFNRFVEAGGERLRALALFQALQTKFSQEAEHVYGWRQWPTGYESPEADAVKTFEQTHTSRVQFYLYLQWLADEQLSLIAKRAQEKGLPIGLYMDMAVGVDPNGAEVWWNPTLYSLQASVGAPPDILNQKGQDWGLPPMLPTQMQHEGYQTFIDTLKENMKYAGALRLDHVMGLMRLYWVPQGESAAEGTYVHYEFEALLGILALESHRNQCLVIGEDLGTVPDRVKELLQHWKVLSYKVFFFENHNNDYFIPPHEYPAMAVATVNTHDLATLKGYWEGIDIETQDRLHLFPSEEIKQWMLEGRRKQRYAILEALQREGGFSGSTDPETYPTLTEELFLAIQQYLAKSNAKIQVIQPEDVFLQAEQVNVPGTSTENPNWRRKYTVDLEDWSTHSGWQHLINRLQSRVISC